ncbi:MAG: penicillin-binding protein 1A [Candidatus Rokubacteria bacterium]|nr:penicillin-binding protein 1A [Candidatus Rokubacteria bacterium]MBI4253971.1 penicillin-binding protein 1A [Candidatus Rokubacteria bacterium]
MAAAKKRPPAPRPPRSRARRWLRRGLLAIGVLTLLVVSAVAVAALWAFAILPRSLPSVTALETLQPIQGTKIYDDSDELLTELHVERRIFVPLAQIPQALRDAVLATEDRRFYSHWGLDPIGIARAVVQNYRRGRIVEGGSTITQQLTKVLFLTPDKSLERKLKEAVLSLELERRYSKDRILEMYLNQVYFGHGAYGVEAAARTYFGKSVSELNVREAALLAGLPRAPTSYSPFEHAEAAKRRREVVLRRMVDYGALKDQDAKRLARAELGLVPPERRRTTGQYFLDHVQQTLEAKYGADLVFKGGLNAYTTLNPGMQLAAEQALRDGLKTLETRSARARPGEHPEGAVVTIEPQTGYVKAIVGGYDFFRSEFNRATQAKRQPGSAFKPFIYIAALEAGLTPATRIDDSPVSYAAGANGQAWKPENYDRKFRGPTTLQQAIEESVNVVTVKLQERIGINRTIQVARRLGITSPLDINLSLALGTSDLSLLELTSSYSALANQGTWMPPVTTRYVTDAQGKLLEEHVPEGREAVAPETAYVITHMLRGVVERGTGQVAKALGRPIAAKTGTTNDYSNAWFIGFTPRLATGVWVGYDRPRSLGRDETGSRVAAPIWVAYMSKILGGAPKEDFPVPERVVALLVDEDPSGDCARPVPMAFIKGSEPAAACAGVGQRRAQPAPAAPPAAAPATAPAAAAGAAAPVRQTP